MSSRTCFRARSCRCKTGESGLADSLLSSGPGERRCLIRTARIEDRLLRHNAFRIAIHPGAHSWSGQRRVSEPRASNRAARTWPVRRERLDGLTRGNSPAEPERITIVAAVAGQEVVLLTVRSCPRDDVEAAMERIVGAFEILA
jgi:hypothetical protein